MLFKTGLRPEIDGDLDEFVLDIPIRYSRIFGKIGCRQGIREEPHLRERGVVTIYIPSKSLSYNFSKVFLRLLCH